MKTQPQQHEHPTLAAAIAGGKAGHKIFPLIENGKIPAIGGWQQRATSDEAEIRKMWTEHDPVLNTTRVKNYNIGISTEGLLVLDVDAKNGKRGLESLAELDTFEGVPATLTVETPTGGLHLYFIPESPVANSAGKLGAGLDVRGNGGSVVGPGSTIDGRAYRVTKQISAAAAPDWLEKAAGAPYPRSTSQKQVVEILDTQPAIQRAEAYLAKAEPAYQGQGGDIHTFKVAAWLKDLGVSELTAAEMMAELWNPRCQPPWDYESLAKKVSNAYHYGKKPVGDASAQADFEAVPVVAKAPPTALPLILPDHQWPAKYPAPLIEGLIDCGSAMLLVGAPKAGKTHAAYAMAHAVASGLPFAGKRTKKGAVLYIQFEGHGGVQRRHQALKMHHGDLGMLAFWRATGNILHEATREQISAQIVATEMAFGVPVVFVIVDTLSAAAPGLEQNAAGDVSAAMESFKAKVLSDTRALLLLHHTPKEGKDPAGSYVFKANVDGVLRVERTGADRKLIAADMREHADGGENNFTIKEYVVGQDMDGQAVKSAVAVFTKETAAQEFDPRREIRPEILAVHEAVKALLKEEPAQQNGSKKLSRARIVQSFDEKSGSTPSSCTTWGSRVDEWFSGLTKSAGVEKVKGKKLVWFVFSPFCEF
jgi:hypothetical protein